MRYFIHISLFLFLFAGPGAQAQRSEEAFERIDTILNKVILRHELAGGAVLHTGGFGLLFRKGYNENWFRKDLWEVEFSGMKSEKQVRVNFYGTYYSNANSYVYGKLNKVYNLRLGLGQQHLLNTKPYWGGVELRFTYYGGFSLGIAKPIYLYIINQSGFNTIDSEKYDSEKHFIDNIYGRAPFLDGIEKTRFYPGFYGKAGLNFEFGEYNTKVKALELGVLVDGYPIPIPVMAFNDPHYYFLNFYLNFTFGKRFNKY
jgi:hypothetical protein